MKLGQRSKATKVFGMWRECHIRRDWGHRYLDFFDRDEAIEGGNILFKRPFYKQDARFIFSSVDQTRPPELQDKICEGVLPLGKVETLAEQLLVFPAVMFPKLGLHLALLYLACGIPCSTFQCTLDPRILETRDQRFPIHPKATRRLRRQLICFEGPVPQQWLSFEVPIVYFEGLLWGISLPHGNWSMGS